jgi:Mrp family chromosome partitioning ATPase
MLAAIPLVKRRQFAGLAPFEANPPGYLVAEPMSPYADAMQTLRSALEFNWQPALVRGSASSGLEHRRPSLQLIEGERDARSPRQQGPVAVDDRPLEGLSPSPSIKREGKVVAVMAAVAGDGATTTAMALARAFALAGRRALIVECDFHRQDLSQYLKRPPAMGLVHVLIGAATWRAAVAEDHATSAQVLVARAPRPDTDGSHAPVEDIFGSRLMFGLLDDLRKNFDVVILDCPPVMARPETRVLGAIADTCLFVTRWGESPKSAAQAAIKRLLGAGAIIAGFAINGAQIDWATSYYDLPRRPGYKDPANPESTPDQVGALAEADWKRVMAAIPERGA